MAGVVWGFRHAFACEAVGESGTGRRTTLAEIYGRGLTIENVIPALLDLKAYPIRRCRRATVDRRDPRIASTPAGEHKTANEHKASTVVTPALRPSDQGSLPGA